MTQFVIALVARGAMVIIDARAREKASVAHGAGM